MILLNHRKVRIGIVGSGFAARFHFQAYSKIPNDNIEIISVYSRNSERCLNFAQEHGIKSASSIDELIENVDIVDLCVPGFVHEEYTIQALSADRCVIVEKPFTGYYGPENKENKESFLGNKFSKEIMLKESLKSAQRMLEAEKKSKGMIFYAEDWVYAPSIQKEVEILKETKGQILRCLGEESHSGSHSESYGIWYQSGGGSLVGKGCHPLSAIIYLKSVEGYIRDSKPIRVQKVSCQVHELTRSPYYIDAGYLRTKYYDVEDYAQLHIVFEDETVADIFASEVVMGGVNNYLEIFANNHRIRCNLGQSNLIQLYNPKEEQLKNVYIVEKIGTKQGWSFPSPDEDWMFGYPQELNDFVQCYLSGKKPQSGSSLGFDTVAVLYSAYLSAERKGQEVEVARV